MPVDVEVDMEIHSDLDERSDAVSSDALQRNASIIESFEGSVQFSVIGSASNHKTKTRKESPNKCRICNTNPPDTTARSFQRSPFSGSKKYSVPNVDTHTEIQCPTCGGRGNVDCGACDGDGSKECGDCYGAGYEEITEQCETCQGKGDNGSCQVCNGSGSIRYKQSCSNCDGTGHVSCRVCRGEGLTDCGSCTGTGNLHQYETDICSISREFASSGLSSTWSDNVRETAASLQLQQKEFTAGQGEFWVQTESADASFRAYEYGDGLYRVVVAKTGAKMSVAWDPATSYPETSWRRKISDLKSRLLW